MKKDHFKLYFDEQRSIRYIELAKDEETKNHKECDQDIQSGIMPEMKDSKYCPITSYLIYIMSLNCQCDLMWQQPKFHQFPSNPRECIYYGPGGVRENTLDAFVSSLAKKVDLGDYKYTNHCLRVTGINTFTRLGFSNKQIMSVTSHKCESSLLVYQKVTHEEKLQMGMSLGYSMLNIPKPQQIQAVQTKAIPPAPSTSTTPV